MAIRVTGSAEIAAVAAACRRAGTDRKIVTDMANEIKREGTPQIITAVKVRATEILPRSGGLGKWTARARIIGVVRRGVTTAGVSIRGSKRSGGHHHDLRRLDLGRVRHLTWGHEPWHAQVVRSGFFTDAVTDEGLDQLEHAVIVAADRAAERIVRG